MCCSASRVRYRRPKKPLFPMGSEFIAWLIVSRDELRKILLWALDQCYFRANTMQSELHLSPSRLACGVSEHTTFFRPKLSKTRNLRPAEPAA